VKARLIRWFLTAVHYFIRARLERILCEAAADGIITKGDVAELSNRLDPACRAPRLVFRRLSPEELRGLLNFPPKKLGPK